MYWGHDAVTKVLGWKALWKVFVWQPLMLRFQNVFSHFAYPGCSQLHVMNSSVPRHRKSTENSYFLRYTSPHLSNLIYHWLWNTIDKKDDIPSRGETGGYPTDSDITQGGLSGTDYFAFWRTQWAQYYSFKIPKYVFYLWFFFTFCILSVA